MLISNWTYKSDFTADSQNQWWELYEKTITIRDQKYRIQAYKSGHPLMKSKWVLLFLDSDILADCFYDIFCTKAPSLYSSAELAKEQVDNFLNKLQNLNSFL